MERLVVLNLRCLIGLALLCIGAAAATPASGANLLRDPGFEVDGAWQPIDGGFRLDPVARTGRHSLRLDGAAPESSAGARQTVVFDPPVRHAFRLSGWSRADHAVPGWDYDLYADVHYADGSALWGRKVTFAPATHDWQYAEATFEVDQPIRQIDLHCLFRHATGTVWFDDVELSLPATAITDLHLAAGDGRLGLRAAANQATRWTATVTQGGATQVVRGEGRVLTAEVPGLQPGTAHLRLELADALFGPASREADVTVAAAPPAPLAWAASSLDTVLPNTPPVAAGTLELTAARGEAVDAQVVIAAPVAATVTARVEPLAGPGSLPAEVVTLSRLLPINGRPDVLAPLAPMPLAAWRAQPLWLAVHVPETAAPGVYQGAVAVTAGGAAVQVPLALTVAPVTLPARPLIPALVGLDERMFTSRYGLREGTPAWDEALTAWYRALLAYRVSPYFCRFGGTVPNHWSRPAPWPIGDPRTDAVLADPRLGWFAIPYPIGGDPAALRAELEHLRARGLLQRGYFYLWDEPNREAHYAKLREWAAAIHAVAPEARILTSYYCGPLDGANKDHLEAVPGLLGEASQVVAMSEWAAGANDDYRRKLDGRLAPGQQWWVYTCLGPGGDYPNVLLAQHPAQNRAVFWRLFRQQAEGYLYWAANAYGRAATPDAPLTFNDPPGDGVLLYPGEAFGATGPLPSARLERLRDGLQDAELLTLLARQAGPAAAGELLAEVYQGPAAYERSGAAVARWHQRLLARLGGR